MRPSNERHPGSERGLQRVCAPLRYVSSGAQTRANSRKLWQSIRVPGSSVSVGMLCWNFARWLPKIGLLLGIFHAPRTENAPYGYERFGAPSENPPYGYARKKKKPSTDDGQLFIKVALRSNVLYRFFFATGPPLRLRSRPPDARDSATLFFALCVAWLLLCFAFAVASFGLAL